MNPERAHYEIGHGKPPGPKFSATNQPSPASKSRGRLKKHRGRELVLAVMEHKGTSEEFNAIRTLAAKYFKIKEKEVTVEIMMVAKQVERAVLNGDIQSFNALMDRGYGRPPQTFNFENQALPDPSEMKLPGGMVIKL